MPSRTLIAESLTPDGERLSLTLEEGHHVVRVRGELLMSSRLSGSEEALAKLALSGCASGAASRVLVGGLGIGFTLRAVLDELGPSARIDVLELLEAVVDWNRGPLATHAGHPLGDPRVAVIVDDVLAHLTAVEYGYDASCSTSTMVPRPSRSRPMPGSTRRPALRPCTLHCVPAG